MRFCQAHFDEDKGHEFPKAGTTFDDELPGFGVARMRDDQLAFVVEYYEKEKFVCKVVGKTHRMSLKKARKRAEKLLTGKALKPPMRTPETVRKRNERLEKWHKRLNEEAGDESAQPPKRQLRLLPYEELVIKLGLTYSRRHIQRLESEGKFPKRVQLSERRHAWVLSEIEDYIKAAMAKRE